MVKRIEILNRKDMKIYLDTEDKKQIINLQAIANSLKSSMFAPDSLVNKELLKEKKLLADKLKKKVKDLTEEDLRIEKISFDNTKNRIQIETAYNKSITKMKKIQAAVETLIKELTCGD